MASTPSNLPESAPVSRAPEAVVTKEQYPLISAYSKASAWIDGKTWEFDLSRMARWARGISTKEWDAASVRIAQLGLTSRSAVWDGRSVYYHMLRTIATSPEQSALHSAKLMKDLVPAGAMAEVLSFMLARYGARQDNASMGKVLDSVVAELCMPGRLKEKIQAYRPYVPADMQDEDIGSMVAKAYRSAADIAIAMAVYRNVPDPSQVAHAYALETNSKRPDGETRDYATMVSKTPQEYRDEAFRKFDTMFSSELRYARDTQENTLFALSALESIRQGKDPVTAVRLVYAPEPQSATAAAAPSGR